MNTLVNTQKRMIIGLGLTGLAVARWCVRQSVEFDLCDTRSELNNVEAIHAEFPQAQLILGALDGSLLSQYAELIVSPGVSIHQPAIQQAIAAGVLVRGDVDVFAEHCSQPIVAITGSNGKSTVTTLVGEMLQEAGLRVAVGGNIGVPVLALPKADIYVLELSSFQLETTHKLAAKVATILNISEDHLDRYDGLQGYIAAKQRIYNHAEVCVVNRDDAATYPAEAQAATISFGSSIPQENEFGLIAQQGTWLALGSQSLVAASELKIKGRHNLANALAALAIVQALDIDLTTVLPALKRFAGLPYRCQWLGEVDGVTFYNDSKGTNVGSTLAAVNGLGAEINGKIWLLAGGEGKGQDFSPLAEACERYVAEVVGFGKDAKLIGKAVEQHSAFSEHASLDEAFAYSCLLAQPNDVVLLSPACASLDQFKDYIHRGEVFNALVEAVL